MKQRIVVRTIWIAIAISVFFGVVWLFVMGSPVDFFLSGNEQALQDSNGFQESWEEGDHQSSEPAEADGLQSGNEQPENVSSESAPSEAAKDQSSKTPQDAFSDTLDTSCPIELPQPHSAVSYKRGVNIETWNTQATTICREYARDVLLNLYDAGATLIEADYLDLFGRHWGCVVQSTDESALTVTIKTLSLSKDENPLLSVTVVRTLPPESLLEEVQP